MERDAQIRYLISFLLNEMPEYRAGAAQFADDEHSQRQLLRSLMNVRPPMPLQPEFLAVQDALLLEEAEKKGIVAIDSLPRTSEKGILLYQGDITRLQADAIVNAANSAMLGCFIPCHGCIDNAIHSAAGLQLREECARLMQAQGHEEPTGSAKITAGYNLPARYVLHTVGPIVQGSLKETDREMLASCYRSCLKLAAEHALASIAFCCISTGEYHFPNREAAEIAVHEVRSFRKESGSDMQVIFNVFKEKDYDIYRELLG